MPPQVLLVARVVAVHAVARPTGDEHPLADHDGAGRAGPRQLALPLQVLRFAPLDRKRLRVGADAAAVRPVKTGPIAGRSGPGAEGEQAEAQRNNEPSTDVRKSVHGVSPQERWW